MIEILKVLPRFRPTAAGTSESRGAVPPASGDDNRR
jgi:hypothetical protein